MRREIWAILVLLGAAGCGGTARGGNGGVRLGEVKRATVSEPAGPSGAPVASLPPAPDRPAAPGFEGATAWLNVDHPLTLPELRGRVVVVDFWTSCCVNCLHTIPILQRLEERFAAEPVVVIGVHAPKFDEERKVGRLRDMLQAYGVAHPIAVDADMAIWETWGVEGWPTLAVLDVAGRVIWAGSGEPDPRELEAVVTGALDEGRAYGALARGPLPGIKPEAGTQGPLRYPGKVLALASGGVAIADTGHNRVVLASATGEVEAVIGSGRPELADGDYASAGFRGPQGMAEVGGDLYVADTGNHTVRRIDRAARTVSTAAGTGEIGAALLGSAERPARTAALRSPWDVLHRGGTLYVALAGSHQIGALDLARGTIRAFAGTGQEARADGPRQEAAFAQPSALAADERELYVLDSETSSVRAIRWDSGAVRTLVGHDLFVFGDRDGDRESARLQHPVGMAWSGGALWVADTYNGKLRRVDPRSGATRTVLGGPDAMGGIALSEPGGVSAGGGALWIADTNRHRVVRVAPGGAATPIVLWGLDPPSP